MYIAGAGWNCVRYVCAAEALWENDTDKQQVTPELGRHTARLHRSHLLVDVEITKLVSLRAVHEVRGVHEEPPPARPAGHDLCCTAVRCTRFGLQGVSGPSRDAPSCGALPQSEVLHVSDTQL